LSLLVGALLGAVVGFLAARLSHVATFVFAGVPTLRPLGGHRYLIVSDGRPRRAIGFRPTAQPTVTWAVLGAIVAALLVVVVSARAGGRLVHDSNRPRGRLLTAGCLVAGAVLGGATVVLAHYRSWISSVHTHRFHLDILVVDRTSWLPSLPIAIVIGAIVGAAGAQVIQLAGMRLVSGRKDRSLIATRAAE
jgi:hypothetical protein